MKIYDRKQLVNFIKSGGAVQYIFFWGHRKKKSGISKSCLSQWYDVSFTIDGVFYPTAEHYMMAEKARLFEDRNTAQAILSCKSPKEAQTLGRKVKNFSSKLWDSNKFKIVIRGNTAKFSQNSGLAAFLESTKEKILVEASPDDTIWGIGLSESHLSANIPEQWKGSNLLGFALLEVRKILSR